MRTITIIFPRAKDSVKVHGDMIIVRSIALRLGDSF